MRGWQRPGSKGPWGKKRGWDGPEGGGDRPPRLGRGRHGPGDPGAGDRCAGRCGRSRSPRGRPLSPRRRSSSRERRSPSRGRRPPPPPRPGRGDDRHRNALPRRPLRRDAMRSGGRADGGPGGEDELGAGEGGRRFERGGGLRNAVTLTPASATNKRRGSHSHDDDARNGCRRRFGSLMVRRGERSGSGQEATPWQRRQRQAQARRRLRLEDWFLAVQLLLNWDDQKTISAENMEQFLKRFLENDAKSKYRITPRLTSEIFLRGILRTLWDIDRLLRVATPVEELKRFTANSPLLLSILRVITYEFMWMPTGTVRMAQQSAADLMERCNMGGKSDREWVSGAVSRMRTTFEQTHMDWDKKRRAREERKRREREEQTAAGGGPVGAVPAARPKGAAAPPPAHALQPLRRGTAPALAPGPALDAKRPGSATSAKPAPADVPGRSAATGAVGASAGDAKGPAAKENGARAAFDGGPITAGEDEGECDEEQEEEEEEEEEEQEEEEEELHAEGDDMAEEVEEEQDEVEPEVEDEEEEEEEGEPEVAEEEEESEEEDVEVTAKAEDTAVEAPPVTGAAKDDAAKDAAAKDAAAEADGGKAQVPGRGASTQDAGKAKSS